MQFRKENINLKFWSEFLKRFAKCAINVPSIHNARNRTIPGTSRMIAGDGLIEVATHVPPYLSIAPIVVQCKRLF